MLSVDLNSAVPPFEQIRAQVAQQAAAGMLPPGTRLPSIRQLSTDLGLAPGTVARAYRELEVTGIIRARGRHGTFIAAGASSPPAAGPEQASELRAAAAEYARRAGQLGAEPAEAVLVLRQLLGEVPSAS
ncbi:MAG TPA: GntR family transcriptional regulator [Streptosporangiaceae bacterium]|nr:GntR family transcriptional regulator [Streptosporangiaceae bacterium]